MALSLFIGALHLTQLTDVPDGLYLDETSIGRNAYLIATRGADEHNVPWPIYFEAFGEYKNPLYIYAVAGLFAVFGKSAWALRLTSVLFFLLGYVGFALSLRALVRSKAAVLWGMLSFGLLPLFFTYSRISFEVISQLAFYAWIPYGVHHAYEAQPGNPRSLLLRAACLGIGLGLSVYSYSTARLLTFLIVGIVFVLYRERTYWPRHITLAVGLALCLIPYAIFAHKYPGALSKRFKEISYITSAGLSFPEKVFTFLRIYIKHLTPDFLLLRGDRNPRHAIGFAGEFYFTTALTSIVGIVLTASRKLTQPRLGWLMVLSLFATIIPAALTDESVPHATRVMVLGVFVLALSAMGVDYLASSSRASLRSLVALCFLLLVVESGLYVRYYFGPYRTLSRQAFGDPLKF